MPLEPQLCVRAECKKFIIEETTGKYNLVNTGGYGAPNIEVAASFALLQISLRNEDGTFTVSMPLREFLLGTFMSLSPNLPSDINGIAEVTSAQAGYGAKYPDGILRLVYNILLIGDQEELTQASVTELVLSTCGIDACVQNKAAEVAKCGCNDKVINRLMALRRLLDAAWCCRNFDAVQAYINAIKNICDNDCKTC